MRFETVPASELMLKRGGSVNPLNHPEETFELLSISAFDKGEPEILKGKDIGSSKSAIQPNDVLISKIVPHIKRCCVVREPIGNYRQIGSGEWIIFRSSKFYPDYLKHFLSSDIFHKQFMNTTAGVGGSLVRARPAGVEKIEIPLPPLEEQKRIAVILDKADAIRRKRQQAIKLADEFLRAVFLDMFGDPVTNPKTWEVYTLGEIALSFQNGIGKNKEHYGSGEKVANISDLYESPIFTPEKYSLLNVSDREIDKYRLSRGDILFVRSSVKKEGVAYCATYESDEICLFSSFMIRLTVDPARVLSKFLSFQLRIPSQRTKLINAANTATITNINQDGLSGINVVIPPRYKQEEFILKQQKVIDLITKNKKQLQDDEMLFQSLSQKIFNA